MAFALPYGYQASLISQVSSIEQLPAFATLEEGQPEGQRMLCTLTFRDKPSPELVALFNQKCQEQGIELWPEYRDVVFADPSEPVLYVCWRKGLAWWGWILIILSSLLLPPLIMAGLWLILPETTKQMIEAVIYLMTMGLVMLVITKMVKGITSPKEIK